MIKSGIKLWGSFNLQTVEKNSNDKFLGLSPNLIKTRHTCKKGRAGSRYALVLGLRLFFKSFSYIVHLKGCEIHKRGQNKELHFNELFSKMTLRPDSGLPRQPQYGILLDKNNP